ncbi:MAG: hypothetical protein ACPGNT_03115 [Rhodospirillales bacterium]
MTLLPIPVIEGSALETIALAGERLDRLISIAEARYGRHGLAIGDTISRAWALKSDSPYLDDIQAVAEALDRPGAWVLNLSFEWSCTTGLRQEGAPTLLRTLDWPLDGLGANLIVVKREGLAGPYWDITWPGFAGVLTALAPDRFAIAINQAPMSRFTFVRPLDWVLNRLMLWPRRALPATHLLRRVVEGAGDFTEAKRLLSVTPLALPAFFTLAGTRPGETCVIERTETEFRVIEGEDHPAQANHYRRHPQGGYARGIESGARLAAMRALLAEPSTAPFDWVREPVLNPTTRLACELTPAGGRLRLRGYEETGPATADLSLGGGISDPQ